MKISYWNGQKLDASKEYKINTIASTKGNGNPWYVTKLTYNGGFKIFSFKSTINCEEYVMKEKNVVSIEEVTK